MIASFPTSLLDSLRESVLTFSEVVFEAVIIEYRQTTKDNGKEFLLELLELAVVYLMTLYHSLLRLSTEF